MKIQFGCSINGEQFSLSVKGKELNLHNDQGIISIKLHLGVFVKWLFDDFNLVGLQIEDLIIEGDSKQLSSLKQVLGGMVAYSGIKSYFSYVQTIKLNKNGSTKVCVLKDKITSQYYSCKCFKKSTLRLNEIHSEIEILKQASEIGLAPTVYEVYESNNSIYLIMEYLREFQELEVINDEFKLLMFNLFQGVNTLHQLKIVHKNIKSSHIMLDDENRIKLVGFGRARNKNLQNNDFRLDIFQLGVFMHQYFQKQNLLGQGTQTNSKETQELLHQMLECNEQLSQNIDAILKHSYFKEFKKEGIQSEIKCMIPKFKSSLFEEIE